MENQDTVLTALEDYIKDAPETIPTVLEEYLVKVASTGETKYAWGKIKKLFIDKMDLVINEFEKQIPTAEQPRLPNVENVNFENMKRRLHSTAERFDGIPFTIQRLCEMLTNPRKHYKKTDKFMRGVEKNLMVVSTVDPFGNKIVNEKQVRSNPAYMNGLDSSNGVSAGRSDTTPLAPFLPPLNQSPSNTSPFAWFNTQISNLTESATSVAPWNFTGSPVVSQSEENRSSDSAHEGSRSPQDGDSNSSSSSGLSSEGDSAEDGQEAMSEGSTTAHQSEAKNGENKLNTRPDRDPNEEPPAKRFKEDESPDSHDGGQGDIGEIKIQITTAAPEKPSENEAEAVQESTQKSTSTLSVSHTPEEVTDRRSSGGFEVTSSAAEETKTDPHRTDSGGFEVTSTDQNKHETSEVQSQQSTSTECKTSGGDEKTPLPVDSERMEEGSSSEADSAFEMKSNAPSDIDEGKSDAEVVTETNEGASSESAQIDSSSKQEVTSSTEQGDSVESESELVTASSENEAVSTTPVADDENSNQSDETYFDACSATPEKRTLSANQSATVSQTSAHDNVDSSDVVESKSDNENGSGDSAVSQTDESSSEAMDTN